MAEARRLILASGSSARKAMLSAAGIAFDVVPADIDEAAIKNQMLVDGSCVEGSDIALKLAAEKALCVARQYPDALVIGSDQVLTLGSRIFSKAKDRDEARMTLKALRGRTHDLESAVALALCDRLLWQTFATARLTMREVSDEFLGHYLDRAGPCLTRSVGAYELEGLGVQLFEKIEGDYFTILGMPLLPLLEELRKREMLTA